MAQIKQLSTKTLQNLKVIDDFVAASGTGAVRAETAIPSEKIKTVKEAVGNVLASLTTVSASGQFSDPVEAAVVAALVKNKPDALKRLAAVKAKGSAKPVDYYEVYQNILADSGLVVSAMPSHDVIRKLDKIRETIDAENSNCGPCNVCNACSACSACAACTVSVVEGMVVAGVAGLTAGTVYSLS